MASSIAVGEAPSPIEQRPPFDPNARYALDAYNHQFTEYAGPRSKSTKPTLKQKTVYTVKYAQALQSRPPWLTVSKVLWVVFGGWFLFLEYAMAGLLMVLSLVFLPFGLQALKFAW